MPDQKAWETLTRGVLEIIEEGDLKRKLASGKPLRVKLGIDPTTPHVHLGFTVVMRKLRQFQDQGHKVILIIGDYTATVGDPSGRNKTRPILTHEEVLRNAETYKQQFFQIVDPEKTEIVHNGDWFSRLTFNEVTRLMSQSTVAQMLEREDFQKRYRGGQPISLHEFLYPMMQAYDSVMIDADIELGGMDQKFNVLRGRELQRSLGKEPQVGIFLPILLGTDGKEKMSKSMGNYIGISEPPQAMYHKLYALPDALVESYFELLTDVPMEGVRARLNEVAAGKADPNALKDELARNIVAQYHGAGGAERAAQDERKIAASIKSGQTDYVPPDIRVWHCDPGTYTIPWLLRETGLAASASAGTSFVTSGSVFLDGSKIEDPKKKYAFNEDHVLRLGKRNFVKVSPRKPRENP